MSIKSNAELEKGLNMRTTWYRLRPLSHNAALRGGEAVPLESTVMRKEGEGC